MTTPHQTLTRPAEPLPAAPRKRPRRRPTPLEELPTGLWTVTDCARYLGKSDDWVYRRTADGTLPVRKHGSDNRYIPAEIVAWATRPHNPWEAKRVQGREKLRAHAGAGDEAAHPRHGPAPAPGPLDLERMRAWHLNRRLRDLPSVFGHVYLGYNRDTGAPLVAELPTNQQSGRYPRAQVRLVISTALSPPTLTLEVEEAPQGMHRDLAEEEVLAVLADGADMLDRLAYRPEVMDQLLAPRRPARRRDMTAPPVPEAAWSLAELPPLLAQRARSPAFIARGLLAGLFLAFAFLGSLVTAFNVALSLLPYLTR